VTYVRYQVGSARVGEETEKDSLTLEIYTDGRITPQDALKKATMILADHLNPFLGNEKPASPGLSPADQKLLKVLTQDVDVLELSVRAMNCLNTANIKLLGELCLKSEARMLKFRNFGKKSLDEIKEKLVPLNLQLAMPLSENLANAIQAEAERAKASKKEEI
jgi:DNA-directed RNA polymerase subunit alpha